MSYFCQIFDATYSNGNAHQKCRKQCDTCKSSLDIRKETIKLKNRFNSKRYYLHVKLKKLGLNFNARSRTVFINNVEQELPKPVVKLRDNFGYNLQTEIL